MRVNSGNSTIHSRVESDKTYSKSPGPDLDAGKNAKNDLEVAQAQSAAKEAKAVLNDNSVHRRSLINQDLDQSENGIKQQILEYPSGNR